MLRRTLFTIIAFFPLLLSAQKDSVNSAVYDWKDPVTPSGKAIKTTVLIEGQVYDMEWLQMSANSLAVSSSPVSMTVPGDEEHLYFIRQGSVNFTLQNTANEIGAGSIALLMPGEKYSLRNVGGEACEYYILKYRSKLPMDTDRGEKAGGSFVINWNDIPFKPHDKGGRRDFFERPTAMAKRLEMHVTTLNGGIKSHDPHTHRAEEIVLMVEGDTEMQIGQGFYKGKSGSVYYLGSNILHAIRNEGTSPCTYYAFQFE